MQLNMHALYDMRVQTDTHVQSFVEDNRESQYSQSVLFFFLFFFKMPRRQMLPRNNSSNPKQVKFKFMMNFNAMKCRNKARATSAAQNRFVSQQTKGKRAAHVGYLCSRSAICMCRLIHTCNPCRREQRIIILKFLFLFSFSKDGKKKNVTRK